MHRIYLHPLPVRIWHWINAATCVMLLLTGVQMRYVGLINVVPFGNAVAIHNWIGFILIANFFLWLFYYLGSDRIKVYHAELNPVKYFRGSLDQALYYGYGIFKGAPNPFHPSIYSKFNPLQAMTYQLIMLLLLPIQCVTGAPALESCRLSQGGRPARRRACHRYGARSDFHFFRVLYSSSYLSGNDGPHEIDPF